MIRHIVFFTSQSAENDIPIFEGLKLLHGIPHKRVLEVARNLKSDPIQGLEPDFVVYGEFDDEAQLAAFKAHPLYQESIRAVRPLRELRIAADYSVNAAAVAP